MNLRLLILAFPLFAPSAFSATWFASATGSATNGTSALPWSVPYSVTNTNPHLQPGDTVLLKDGTFTCSESDPLISEYENRMLIFRKAGTAVAKITYRAQNLWQFHFNGTLAIPLPASNIVVHGFHIYFAGMTNRNVTNYTDFADGIEHFAPGVEILHNLIENCAHPGIGSWSTTAGKNISGNIIRFVGYQDYGPDTGGSGSPGGSAMYLQQSAFTPEALIQGNISYHNYTTGMKAYGGQNINGFHFYHNVVTDNGQHGIFYHQDSVDSQGVKFSTNYLWKNGNDFVLGYSLGNANPSNAVISGNYSVTAGQDGTLFFEDGWKACVVTNNTFVNTFYRRMLSVDQSGQTNYVGTHTWDYNTYYAGASVAFGSSTFNVGNTYLDFTQWKARIGGDANSTLTVAEPTALVASAFRPSNDTNFVHVAVFNWPSNATTTVNLSAYFPAGAQLAIYDAQDIPNAYTNLTFSGSTVTLDLTRTNRATMLGAFAQMAAWTGFDPRFRAFVVYRPPPRVASLTANTATIGTLITQ